MANVNDVRSIEAQADKEKEKLKTADMDERDREALSAYANHLRRRVASGSYKTYMSRLRTSACRTETPLIEMDSTTDVDALLDAHEEAGCTSAAALNNHLSALRGFLKWLDGVDDHGHGDYRFRQLIENVKPNGANPGTEPVDPEFVFTVEEVTALTEAAEHPRDAALIQFLADAGPRISLALQLKRGDVSVPAGEPGTYRPNPEGSGQKKVPTDRYPLHESQRHLRRWINEFHPDDHPDAPLFTKRRGYDPEDRENGAIHPKTAENALKAAAENAGIDPDRAHPHNFRKTAVTRMRLKHDMSWDAIQHRTGWSDKSLAEMKETYRRIDEGERLAIVQRELGVESDDDEAPEPTPEPCGNCGREVEATWSVCPFCGADPKGSPASLRQLAEALAEADPAVRKGLIDELQNLD